MRESQVEIRPGETAAMHSQARGRRLYNQIAIGKNPLGPQGGRCGRAVDARVWIRPHSDYRVMALLADRLTQAGQGIRKPRTVRFAAGTQDGEPQVEIL